MMAIAPNLPALRSLVYLHGATRFRGRIGEPAWQITTMLKQILNILKPGPSARRRRWRLNRRLVEIEQVETRLLLAAVYDSGPDGETLTIELEENDSLAVIAEPFSYAFLGTIFTDAGVSDPTVLEGVDTSILRLSDLNAYSSVTIVSGVDSASIEFLDSGSVSYRHDISVDTDHDVDVTLTGTSAFGDSDFTIQTAGKILATESSRITVNNGHLSLSSGTAATPTSTGGIQVEGAELRSLGAGSITLVAHVKDLPADSDAEAAIVVKDSSIRTLLSDEQGGSVSITASTVGALKQIDAVHLDDALLESVAGDVQLNGTTQAGAGDSAGVRLRNRTVIRMLARPENPGEISIIGASIDNDSLTAAIVIDQSVVESTSGDIFLTATAENRNAALQIQYSSIRTMADGDLIIHGTTAPAGPTVIGVYAMTQLAVENGELRVSAETTDSEIWNRVGIRVSSDATLESVTGPIRLNFQHQSNHAVTGLGLSGKVLSNMGPIVIDLDGDLELGRDARLGAPDAVESITMRAKDFHIDPESEIQTTSWVAMDSNTFQHHLAVGDAVADHPANQVAVISQNELAAFHTDIGHLRFGLPDGSRRVNTVHLGDVTFDHEIVINATWGVVLTGDIAIPGHPFEILGPTSLAERAVNIEGDLTLTSFSLNMRQGLAPDHLRINGTLTLDEHVAFNPVWNFTEASSNPSVVFETLVGQFHTQSPESSLSRFPGARLEYQNNAVVFRVRDGAPNTQIIRAGEHLEDYSLIENIEGHQNILSRVEPVGDVNGDGRDDFLIVPFGQTQLRGKTLYLLLGREDLDFNMDFEQLKRQAIQLNWPYAEQVGRTISHADLNGDGLQDIVIRGSLGSGVSDRVQIVFGREAFPSELNVWASSAGVSLITGFSSENTLTNVEGVDDLNDDQLDELVLSTRRTTEDGQNFGSVFVLAGMDEWPDLVNVEEETLTSVSISGEAGVRFGTLPQNIGDVDGDGFGNFMVAAEHRVASTDVYEDALYVFNGSADFFQQSHIDQDGSQNVFYGHEASLLDSVVSVGDLNGDGSVDLVIGEPTSGTTSDGSFFGAVNIYWSAFASQSLDLASGQTPKTTITGPESWAFLGRPIEVIPDISGDGIPELLMGTSTIVEGRRESLSDLWLIRGRETWPPVIDLAFPGAADFRLIGTDRYIDGHLDPESRRFGFSFVAGDFDGNGQSDFAIAAAGEHSQTETPRESFVHVFSGNTFYDVTPPQLTLTAPVGDPTNAALIRFRVELSEAVEGLTASDFELVTTEGVINAGDPLVQADPAFGEGYVDLYIRRFNDSSFMTLRMATGAVVTDEAGLPLDTASVQPITLDFASVGPDIVGPGDVTMDSNPTMRWWKTHDTESYDIWIQPIDSDADPVIARNIPGDTGWHIREWQPVQPLAPGPHRFWIRSNFADGSSSPWSSKAFTVNPASLISALNDAELFRPQVEWNEIPGVEQYRVFVTEITRQESRFVDTTVTGTSFQPDVDWTNGRYRFWIAGISPNGFQTKWSEAVTLDIAPEVVPIATTVASRPVFQFSSVPGTEQYEVFINGNGNVYRRTVETTSLQFDEDLAEGHYRIWVRGRSGGVYGPWSDLKEFSVGGITRVHTPSEPLSNPLIRLTWPSVPEATSYDVVVRNGATGEDTYRLFGLTKNQTHELPLPDGEYRVWVKTHHSTGAKWGAETRITVHAQRGAVSLTASDLKERSMNLAPQFRLGSSWAPPDHIEIYVTSSDGVRRHDHAGSSVQWTPDPSLGRGEYRWWYRGRTDDGDDSGILFGGAFNTNGRTALDIIRPSDSPNRPLFLWQPVDQIKTYELRIDLTGDSERIFLITQMSDGETYFRPTEDFPAGSYRAWVRPRDENGLFGSWSLLRVFEI